MVLEYAVWYTANIVNISVFGSPSIGSGPVAAVVLCVKREGRKRVKFSEYTVYESKQYIAAIKAALSNNKDFHVHVKFLAKLSSVRFIWPTHQHS